MVPTQTGWAQGASDEAKNMARARFADGVTYYDGGQFELARASFLQAYALRKHPAILINLAWSSLKSGHALEAARYFKQFLMEDAQITDTQKGDANEGLNQARAKLGQVEVRAAPGSDVTIDNDHVGTTPLPDTVDVEVGPHTVRVRTSDGSVDAQRITVAGGERVIARFAQVAHAVVPPPSPGPPVPSSPAAAEETLPTQPSSSPATAEAEPTQPPEPLPSLPSSRGAQMSLWPSYVGFGLAAPSLVVAGFVGLQSVPQARNNANTTAAQILGKSGTCPPAKTGPKSGASFVNACNTYSNDNALIATDKTVAWTLLGTGAALVAASTIYLVVAVSHNARSSDSAPIAIGPIAGPSLMGLEMVGAF